MGKFGNGLPPAHPAWLQYSASYPLALAVLVAAAGKAPKLPIPMRQQAA